MNERLLVKWADRYPPRRRLGAALAGLLVAGAMAAAVHAPAAHADAAGRGGDFVPLAPSTHLLDTRNGTGGVSGARGPGSTTPIAVLGKAGVPAAGVRAVLVDVTLVTPSAGTFLVLWPDGTPRPVLSMIHAVAGQTISNSAVVPVAANGRIDLYNSSGTTHVTIDVQGYFTQISSGGTGLGGYLPVTPTRLVDTRSGLGAPKAAIPANGSLTVTVATGPVPTTANAVFLNLVVLATKGGWLAAFPAGGASGSSIIDFVAGTTNSGAAVKVGQSGRITVVNHSGAAVNLVIDAQGYFSGTSTEGAGLRTTTARLLDTRASTPLAAHATIDVAVGGTNGLPTRGIAGAAVNLAEISATASGLLRAWPLGDPEPTTVSHTNFPAGAPRDALAVVRPGVEGKIRIRNASAAAINFIVDLEGWFADPLPPVPVEQFSRMSAMQATPAPGASAATLEYAYVNNIGQLVHGHQTDPDSTSSVQYTVISGNEAFSGQPALAEQADGRLQVAAHNTDSDVWVNTQATKSPPAWGTWVDEGGSMSSHAALVRLGDGTLVVFATDADGRLWSMRQNSPNGAYASWRSLGDADLVGTPTAAVVSNGVQVFALDTAGALKTALYSGGVLAPMPSG